MEYIDIVDENNNPTGKVKEKQQAHEDGNFHRTAHVWIINDKNELLLQKRSASKKTHPNCWDISGAGHIKAGESVIDAVKREVKALTNYEIEDYKLQLEEVDKVKYYKIEDLEEEKRNNNKLFDFCYWEDKDFFDQMRILKKFKKENIITL